MIGYFKEINGGMKTIGEMIANGDSVEAMYCADPEEMNYDIFDDAGRPVFHVKYSCELPKSFFPMKKITDMKLGELTKPGLQFFELCGVEEPKTEVTVE